MSQYEAAYNVPEAVADSLQQQPREYKHFKVRPLSGALGAEITDVSLSSLTATAFQELRQAFSDHLVLTFPGQGLDMHQQVEFAGRFGPLMRYNFVQSVPGHDYVTEIRSAPGDKFNFGGVWHTDSMNFERPPKITLLQCREAPAVGGDTSFANLYLAWETLSVGMQKLLRHMHAVAATSLSYGSSAEHGREDFKQRTATPTQMEANEENDEFEHPVARTHPDTGRLALYLSRDYSAHFVGMTRSESLPLMRYLWEHASQPSLTCRVSWRPETLTMWDNRCCKHYAHNDYPGNVRVMWRTIIEGESPC